MGSGMGERSVPFWLCYLLVFCDLGMLFNISETSLWISKMWTIVHASQGCDNRYKAVVIWDDIQNIY